MNLIKWKKIKQKYKTRCAKSNLVHSKDFTIYKYHSTKKLAFKLSFDSKQIDLRELRNILELFYGDTEEIRPNSECQKKDLKKKICCVCYSF